MVAEHGGELGAGMEVVEGCCLPKDSNCHPNYQHNSNNENSIYIYIYTYSLQYIYTSNHFSVSTLFFNYSD